MPVTSFYKQVVEEFLEGKSQWSFIEQKDAGSQLGYGCMWSHRGCVVQRPAATALSRMLSGLFSGSCSVASGFPGRLMHAQVGDSMPYGICGCLYSCPVFNSRIYHLHIRRQHHFYELAPPLLWFPLLLDIESQPRSLYVWANVLPLSCVLRPYLKNFSLDKSLRMCVFCVYDVCVDAGVCLTCGSEDNFET